MSTRASIIYKPDSGVHIYEELLTGNVCIEVERGGTNIGVVLMTIDEWTEMGLPTQPNKLHNPRFIRELVKACKTFLYAYSAHKHNFDFEIVRPVLREMAEALEKMGEITIMKREEQEDEAIQ